jgi:uncharacterized protein YrrD
MRTLFSTIRNAPVISYESRNQIGSLIDVLIHPKTLQIEGVYVAIPQFILSTHRFIAAADITRIGSTIVVSHEDVLTDASDIFRLQPLLQNFIPILGARVFTQDSQYLGKAVDVQFDTETLSVIQIVIKKYFFEQRIVAVQRIKNINKQGIWIADNKRTEHVAQNSFVVQDHPVFSPITEL